MPAADARTGRFYFSLPRLIAHVWGGSSEQSEGNRSEAFLPGLAVFALTWLFAVHWLGRAINGWAAAIVLVALVFGQWMFWVVILYLNSLVIHLLRLFGFFRTLPDRRMQSFLIIAWTTLFACSLAATPSWARFAGYLWIAAVALNLVAAAWLLFLNAVRPRQ